MLTKFCPYCWSPDTADSTRCTVCGADIAALRDESYAEKLVWALNHPVAETRLRAVSLLSQLGGGAKPFLPELQNSFVSADDVYFKASVVQAVGNISGRESFAFLTRCLEDPSFLVRLAALRSLAGILSELPLEQRTELKKKFEQVIFKENSATVREQILFLLRSLPQAKPG